MGLDCCSDTLRVYQGEAQFSFSNDTDSPMLYTIHTEKCSVPPTRTFHEGDDDGEEVAESRQRCCTLFSCKDVYDITVQPGTDALLVFAACIAQDITDAQRKQQAAGN